MSAPVRRIVVAGLGNLLRGDDGVGVHAVRAMAGDARPGVEVIDIGTSVWHLDSLLQDGDRLLAIDAVHGNGPSGTVYVLAGNQVLAGPGDSVHSLGAAEVLALPALHHRHVDLTVVGCEPQQMAYSMDLSAPVLAALPRVVDAVRRLLAAWAGPTPLGGCA